jgi:hypothetical protein
VGSSNGRRKIVDMTEKSFDASRVIDGEKFTIPVQTQVPVVYDPPEAFTITPTLLKTSVGGPKVDYSLGGGIAYTFNSPSPYCLILRSDHLAQLIMRYGKNGLMKKELSVVAEKDWPTEHVITDAKGNTLRIPLSFKAKVEELRRQREAEHAKLFPDFLKKK